MPPVERQDPVKFIRISIAMLGGIALAGYVVLLFFRL